MKKTYVDIAFIVPLREEFDRLTDNFPITTEHVETPLYWVDLDVHNGKYSGVAILQDSMGKAAATRATDAILQRYEVGILVVVGIAGGLSGDVAIGDVCFTGPLFDILENSKISENSKGGMKIEFNSIPYKTDPRATFAMKYISLGTDTRDKFEEWQLTQFYQAVKLVPGEFMGRKNTNEKIGIPKIHEGSVVCGSVSKSELYKSNIAGLDRKLLAIETETGGVFASAEPKGIPVVTIRGICDYADGNKNKLEEQTNGHTRFIAASNAVSFVKIQFENPQMDLFLSRRKTEANGVAEILRKKDELDNIVNDALKCTRSEVHLQLGNLSPEYKGKPEGYRLPLPRIKASKANATVSPPGRSLEPQSILEAITKHRVALIGVSKTHPDSTLPWIIASELCLIEVNGKQAVPIVIDGERIKPPRGDFARQTEFNLEALEERQDARPVFILQNFPVESRTRVEYLKSQLDKHPEAHFVVISKDEGTPADTTTFVLQTGAERFELCEISFVELSSFFKRSFQLPDQEAGVIALRLQDMFAKFELNAHPSYFAGLNVEILSSLLRANRRAELLQLAVGGFLSFVVAGDEDQIVLSRTTRETFLRQLVFRMKVEGDEFNRESLIAFAEVFADEKDFEIDSILFVSAFQEKGIIHFNKSGNVQISLPFIESYLLASELALRPEDSVRYFNLKYGDFDYPTFDLYCEMNLSNEIVNSVIVEMKSIIREQLPVTNQKHILLTNEIRPALVDKPGRYSDLQDQLQKSLDDVKSNRSNSSEKQVLIDVAAKVEADVRTKQQAAEMDRPERDVEASAIGDIINIWTIGIVLLGSGSERIDRDPKRELSGLIVKLSSLMIDKLLRSFPSTQFDQVKLRLKADDSIRALFGMDPEDPINDKQRSFVEAIIDAYEFSLISYPIRIVFEQLGNIANQPVLRTSVASVSSDDLMENLIARVWAAEINAAKEKPELIQAIGTLPVVHFLRHTLSTHFVARVFWNHWEMKHRLALLDAAEEALKPISGSIDKGKVKRMVEKGESENIHNI